MGEEARCSYRERRCIAHSYRKMGQGSKGRTVELPGKSGGITRESRELAQGAWLVAPVSPQLVFEGSMENLWDDVVRSLGIEPATLVQTQGVN